MSEEATELRLGVAARAENLALVRQALAGLGDAKGISAELIADLKQIATEACMNAVVHAYPGEQEGRIEVRARVDDREVSLAVRDWGVGFRPRPAGGDDHSLRLGLPLIASLADSFEVEAPRDGGTEIRVRLALAEGNADARPARAEDAAPPPAQVAVTGDAARQVVARVLAMAATRAGLSLDRMSDGVLLSDVISTHDTLLSDVISTHDTGDFSERRVGVEIDESRPGTLWMRVGPFVDGGAKRLVRQLELPGMEQISLAKLADRVDVEPGERGEFVVIELGGR